MALPKNFARALGIGFIGLVVLVVISLFVGMLFVSRGTSNRVSGLSEKMMYGNPLSLSTSTMMVDSVGMNRQRTEENFAPMTDRAGGVPDMVGVEKKIIKTGSLNVRVQNVDEAVARVTKIAMEMGGDVSDSRFTQVVSGTKSGTLTVKVPVDKFQETFSRLKEVAIVVLSENTAGTDVTAQYIDLQARINNKKAAEVTLQTLFERAVKISDVIEITDKLAMVRSEIESLEGQARYLNAQASMSSIGLTLTEDVVVATNQGFRPMQTLKESLSVLIQMLGNFVQKLIRFVVVGLPVMLVYGVIIWFIYRFVRRVVTNFFPRRDDVKRVMRKK